MKRIALLLAALALLGFSGCKDVTVNENHGSDQEGVYLEILSAERTLEDGTVLEVRWNNETDKDVLYGSSFGIQRLVGNTWVKVKARPNVAFTMEAYRLKAHSTATKTYQLDWAYNLSASGTYRLTTEYSFWDSEPDERFNLWVQFQVGNTPEAGEQNGLQDTEVIEITEQNCLSSIRIRDWETWKGQYRDTYDAAGQYRSSFFRDKDLLLILLGEGSSSVRHKLLKTEYADGILSVWIEKKVPKAMTMDITRWYLLVPLEKDLEVKDVQTNLGSAPLQEEAEKADATGEVFREPPKLEIGCDGGRFEAQKGTFSWFYDTGDGTWAAVMADALHPLQMKEHLERISSGSSHVQLLFADEPDSVTVRCWPDDNWGKTHASSETARMQNDTVELHPGGWIYEVTAAWNEDGSSYHGTATYVFYMAPATAP